MTETLICPKCTAPMVLRETKRFTHRNGSPRKFYGCTNWPECNCTHGAHPDGSPLGTPADDETKLARIAAHDAFDRLWKPELGGRCSRNKAYRVMQDLMGMTCDEAHIGKFTKEQCEELVRRLAEGGVHA